MEGEEEEDQEVERKETHRVNKTGETKSKSRHAVSPQPHLSSQVSLSGKK